LKIYCTELVGMINCSICMCYQADSDGVVHRYCPAHLEDSDLKPNVTCAVYNHDGTGITTVVLLCGTYPAFAYSVVLSFTDFSGEVATDV